MKRSFWYTIWVLPIFTAPTALTQTNSWLHPSSGYWHEPYWSAGVLPGAEQTILITNAGSKTVTISSETAQNYPETLNVKSIHLFSPDSLNTLLLDAAGFTTPLSASGLYVGSGGAVEIRGSAVDLSTFQIQGAVNHSAFSELKTGTLELVENGTYTMTNGMLRARDEFIGGPNSPGTFNHYGGTNLCSLNFRVAGLGTYTIIDGELHAPGGIVLGSQSTTFNHAGGIVRGTVVLGGGVYLLSGGLRTGNVMHIPWRTGRAGVVQTGGTNVGAIQIVPEISFYGDVWGEGSYTLEDGELRSTSLNIGAFGSFSQSGGVHSNETMTLSRRLVCKKHQPGYPNYPDCVTRSGSYSMQGGTLVSSSIVSGGSFYQTGGRLIAESISGSFVHDGGQLTVNHLTVGSFYQVDGELTVNDISIRSGNFSHFGGTVDHRGWIAMEDGSWFAQPGEQSLGALTLNGNEGSPSTLIFPDNNFPDNRLSLRFADSSDMAWSGGARLIVQNWNGSFLGGGLHQLRFGSHPNGLAPRQLRQIYFENPAGLSGLYPARIRSNGEVVPKPMLAAEKRNGNLVLQWPQGFVLQTATNVTGPYEDMRSVANSLIIESTEPCRFFRLREVE